MEKMNAVVEGNPPAEIMPVGSAGAGPLVLSWGGGGAGRAGAEPVAAAGSAPPSPPRRPLAAAERWTNPL